MTGPNPHGDGVDGRSVGELLLDADLVSRGVLWDPDPDTARAKTRTWGEVVEAGAELWAAIPDRTGDPSMARIHELTAALHRTQQRTQWPGAGPTDPHLEEVTNNLIRAAELVAARRHPTAPLTNAGHLDSEATRTRTMHILYVSAHGVSAALNQHMRKLQQRLDSRRALAPGDSLRHARDTWERVNAVERLAGSHLRSRWPAALTGEHRDPVQPSRLEQALARWDLQAHRTLAASPTAANLRLTVDVQRNLAVASGVITAAAASREVLDPQQHTDRLRPALSSLEHAWGQLGSDLGPLIGRQRRLDPQLLLAGNEVRAALREVTHDHAGFASPATMADRVDLTAATASLQRGLSAAVDLAHVVRDALEDPELTVAARGAHAMATASGVPDTPRAWVSAADLHHDRPVPLPHPARSALVGHTERVITTAVAADSASALLDDRSAWAAQARTRSGPRHDDYGLPAPTMRVPGLGCER